ncbi:MULTISPECIES: hypothetical protein [unclassified Xanthobacter]|uniref:hypothetical protein n=1 Tax=unclassified Xanthobacter TaxID=2623496 RepID=UPI001F23AB23|nr:MULTISPECIES: hypothetical protein [unclassified Xanthobacter]
MQISHFTDERIAEITGQQSPMTAEERSFLIANTPTFEECAETADELSAMGDVELMRTAYSVWADYASCL